MSDWSLGKKLNSQIADVPLNHLIWLNDYKTYGENSYVFRDKKILHELYKSYSITAVDSSIQTEAFNFLLDTNDKNLGLFIGNMPEVKATENSIDWTSIHTIDQLFSDDVFDVIRSSEKSEIRTFLIGKYVERLGSNQELMARACASSKALKMLYDLYTETDMSPFLNSPYLYDSAMNSPLHETVSYTGTVRRNNTDGYVAYNSPCFVLSASQTYANNMVSFTRVFTLSGIKSTTTAQAYGSDGTTMTVNDFASTAKMHPYYESDVSASATGGTFYMSILKFEQ